MTYFSPKNIKLAIIACLSGPAVLFATSTASAQDAYVVYASADKQLLREVKEQTPDHIKTRTYNIGLLSLADYSAKQKVRAKLMQADYLIFLSDEARSPFKGNLRKENEAIVIKNISDYEIFTNKITPEREL